MARISDRSDVQPAFLATSGSRASKRDGSAGRPHDGFKRRPVLRGQGAVISRSGV